MNIDIITIEDEIIVLITMKNGWGGTTVNIRALTSNTTNINQNTDRTEIERDFMTTINL